MKLTRSNIHEEVSKMTEVIIQANLKIRTRIKTKDWLSKQELYDDSKLWEFDIKLLNQINAFLRQEKLDDATEGSAADVLSKESMQFFNNLTELKSRGKVDISTNDMYDYK